MSDCMYSLYWGNELSFSKSVLWRKANSRPDGNTGGNCNTFGMGIFYLGSYLFVNTCILYLSNNFQEKK